VGEGQSYRDNRIMSFVTPAEDTDRGPLHADTPADRIGIVLTNRQNDTEFTYNITLKNTTTKSLDAHSFNGHRYSAVEVDTPLGSRNVVDGVLHVTVPPMSIEFWLQY